MPIAVLILVLVAYAYVMAAYPEYRTPGLVVGGVAAVGLGAYFWLTEPETERATARILAEEVVLDRLALDRSARGATLTGRVVNRSGRFRLREMSIALRLYDCPSEAAPEGDCAVIGDAMAIARPDVPPGQVRAFSASYVFANMPPVAGVLRWEWSILGLRATEPG